MAENNPKTVVTAVGADILVAVAKAVAAVASGSASMAAEALHSFVDGCNQMLLIVGERRGARPPDERHPFGYGAAVYFWAIVVAVVMFWLGGCLTVLEGIVRFMHPEPPKGVVWNYVVYAVAAAADGYAWFVGIRELRRRYPTLSIPTAVGVSKDPSVFVVVLEDGAALVGVLIATIGTVVSQVTNDGHADAVASIGIGGVLLFVAVMMIREIGSLLIGEAVDSEVVDAIREVAQSCEGVEKIERVLTLTLGPRNVVVTMDLAFRRGIPVEDAAGAIDGMQAEIKRRKPQVREIFVHVERGQAPAAA